MAAPPVQLKSYGSTMGSDVDFKNMLAFVNEHKIVPVIDSIYDLKDGNSAVEKMANSPQFGKIILKI